MRRLFAFSLVLAAGSSSAIGQSTRLTLEASANAGASWHPRVEVAPGATVYVRLRVSLDNAGTHTVLGLGGITCQPTLSNWRASVDERLRFTNEETGSGVDESPQTNTGRINPFAPTSISPPFQPTTSHLDPGNILRFAQPNNVNLTTNLAWGVGTAQLPHDLNPTGFRAGISVVVFRYAVRLADAGGGSRDLIASVPRESVLQSRASWYRTPTGTMSLLAPIDSLEGGIVPATIRVIPAPPIPALLLLALALTPSRRRSRP